MGYYPNENEFNFAITSQDLYYSYNLYKITNNPNIKNIIISFSDFSSYHSLAHSPSPYSNYPLYYEALCDIPLQSGKNNIQEVRELKNIIKIQSNKTINNSYNGQYLHYQNQQYQENKDDALHWALKYNKRFYTIKHEAIKYLLKFLEDTNKNNQQLIIVITPIMSDLFKKVSIPEDELFRELYMLAKPYKQCKIINYRNSKDFTKEDFADWEHLNCDGAKKLANKIRTLCGGQ